MDDKEHERLGRLMARANIKRTAVISRIRAIHTMAMRVADQPDLVPSFSILAADLDMLWSEFKAEDESVLDYLVTLNKLDDYSPDLGPEVRQLISDAKAVALGIISQNTEAVDLSYLRRELSPSRAPSAESVKSFTRLPEIPLPIFAGDFREWPAFRDKFSALVDTRPHLSNIEKMYYLISCLKGVASEAVQGIPVSSDNYQLVMSTLTSRFNRPRLVATSLVEQLLHAPTMSQESLQDLNKFLFTFQENISVLNAMKIPELGSFILFSMAFRCLPLHTRKLFEASSSADYPSITQLLDFVRSRVSILEVVDNPHKNSATCVFHKGERLIGQFRKGGEQPGKRQSSRPMSLITSKSDNKCPCCSEAHKVASCTQFKSWSAEERIRWTREHRLCFICFSTEHWVPQCKIKANCLKCSRKHHFLLHTDDERRNNKETPPSNTSLCASVRRPPASPATSVVLGTALVHVRDRSGSWQTMRALIDCASQISAITAAGADRLGLKRSRWTTPISGLAGVPVVNVQGQVDCSIQPRFAPEPVISVRAWVLPTITGDLPKQTLSSQI